MAVGNDFLVKLRGSQVIKKTITRSIRDLIADFQVAKIVIPAYQRSFVWETDKQCRFIESIFLQIPIPPIFLLERVDNPENDTSGSVIFEVIDGVQRITTLTNFVNGALKLSGLETLVDLNQAKFAQLPNQISSTFQERQIDTIIIESGTNPEIQFEVFGRLNQGSVSLNPQELRNCMFHGEFNNFLIDCSTEQVYRELLKPFSKFHTPKEGKPDKNRMLDVELILRFFSLYEYFDPETNKYPDVRVELLNNYMRQRIKSPDTFLDTEELRDVFIKVSSIVLSVFNGKQFRIFNKKKESVDFTTTFNQAIFDVQMLGFVDYEISQIQGNEEIIYETFLDVSSYDLDFIDATSKATGSKVNQRVISWKNRLKDIIESPEKYIQKLKLKLKLFRENPYCTQSDKRIELLEQADVLNGKLYHRCSLSENDIIKFEATKTKVTKNDSVEFVLNQTDYEVDNLSEAIDQILEIIRSHIHESEFDIDRLSSLSFVGTHNRLNQQNSQRKKKIYKSLKLENQNRETLYFDASGGRNEVLQQLREMARLFDFMRDFQIED